MMAVAHGGKVVCSGVTAELVEGVALVDLGEHRLRDLDRPLRVFQVKAAACGCGSSIRSQGTYPSRSALS
jgi:class 3 adenylate cyclase